jgi:glutamate-1-semialdehyde aminotransferase
VANLATRKKYPIVGLAMTGTQRYTNSKIILKMARDYHGHCSSSISTTTVAAR